MQEFLTTKQLALEHKVSTRNIRKKAKNLYDEGIKHMLYKDHNNDWRIHHLLTPLFAPERPKRAEKYYALSFDPIQKLHEKDIHQMMKFVRDQIAPPFSNCIMS